MEGDFDILTGAVRAWNRLEAGCAVARLVLVYFLHPCEAIPHRFLATVGACTAILSDVYCGGPYRKHKAPDPASGPRAEDRAVTKKQTLGR